MGWYCQKFFLDKGNEQIRISFKIKFEIFWRKTWGHYEFKIQAEIYRVCISYKYQRDRQSILSTDILTKMFVYVNTQIDI